MKFTTTIHQTGNNTGIPVPEDVVESFGRGKRFPVAVTLNGYTYRSQLVFYKGQFVVSLSAAHREAAGVSGGPELEVEMVVDDAPREVEIPEDLAAAFADAPRAAAFFETISYSNKKEFVRWITEAKKEETRRDRLAKTIALLNEGKAQR